MTHTPGPWMQYGSTVYSPHNGNVCLMTEIHTGTIGSPPIGISSDDWKEAMQNARLIAAAPDLLEACKALVAFLDKGNYSNNNMTDIVNAARAAIAKAEPGAREGGGENG